MRVMTFEDALRTLVFLHLQVSLLASSLASFTSIIINNITRLLLRWDKGVLSCRPPTLYLPLLSLPSCYLE